MIDEDCLSSSQFPAPCKIPANLQQWHAPNGDELVIHVIDPAAVDKRFTTTGSSNKIMVSFAVGMNVGWVSGVAC